MKKSNNFLLGQKGEEIAAFYLANHGYTIIERNFKKRYGDIDIVAKKGETLIFVEVKTRKTNAYGLPVEAITPWKLRNLLKYVEYYKLVKNLSDVSMRIDLISVSFHSKNHPEIKHFQNITF